VVRPILVVVRAEPQPGAVKAALDAIFDR